MTTVDNTVLYIEIFFFFYFILLLNRSQVSWLPRHSAARGMEQVVSLTLGAMGQSFQLRAAWGSNQGNQRKHQLKLLTIE